MFREMRRSRQQLSAGECERILREGSYGVLAVSGDSGYPYAVPLSYAYEDGKLYFHGARSGHRLDAVLRDQKTSFCVVGKDDVLPEKYTTRYVSVIAFGKAEVIENETEKRHALELLGGKYNPSGTEEELEHEVSGALNAALVTCLTCEHVTGKQAKELI